MSGLVLLVLCYGLLAVFLAGFLGRSIWIARLPVHLRWELAPVPKEKTRGRYGGSYFETYEWWKQPREESLLGELVYMGKEIVFLKALWEHNRKVWWFSFPFHVGLYLLMAATGVLVLGGLLTVAGAATVGETLLHAWLPVLVGVGCGLGAVGALGLFASRLARWDLRAMTSGVAYFNLVLLLAVFVTGGLAVLTVPDFGAEVAGFAGKLLRADASAALPGLLAGHVLVSVAFLAYLPFSQMMHFVAKYFTYHQVRWDDEPMAAGSHLEKEVLELLKQPVTWSAPHLKADGVKNWVDVATEEVEP
ncbi:MAG: respiratory nitrate reductase subunit gamma [Gemmatimonadota bacterium]|jgi:nitrate reductase gamma subunit